MRTMNHAPPKLINVKSQAAMHVAKAYYHAKGHNQFAGATAGATR